jgi:hypothetical protein
LVATITADTSPYKVIEERLGPSIEDDEVEISAAGVTSSGTVYLDEFISLSTEAAIPHSIYLPLLGR